MKISTILDKVDEKQLFVPAFQREYVWKRDDAKLLIDSLIKEYPTGTMLTWETDQPPELKGPHPSVPARRRAIHKFGLQRCLHWVRAPDVQPGRHVPGFLRRHAGVAQHD